MKYLMMVFFRESEWEALPPEEKAARRGEFDAYSARMAGAGHLLDGRPLHPVRTATTLRTRHGKLEMVDGPFAETKEQFAGYFLIEARDLDQALAFAAECPAARYGTLEVRPCAPRGDEPQ